MTTERRVRNDIFVLGRCADEAALFACISGSFQTNLVGSGVMVIIRVVSGSNKREVIAGDILRGNCK